MNNTKPHTLLAIFEAKPGKELALKEVLTSLINPTLQEEGCINYDLHICQDNPAKFMFYENWIDKAAHAKHCETPHIKAWRAVKNDLIVQPSDFSCWEIIR